MSIFCLTTSNLPQFSGLNILDTYAMLFLQHHTVSTTMYHFLFGSAFSFFLELLVIALCFSPLAYWTLSDLRGYSSNVISFCLFLLFVGFLQQEYWSDSPISAPVDHVCQFSSMTHLSCIYLHGTAHSFIELCNPLH